MSGDGVHVEYPSEHQAGRFWTDADFATQIAAAEQRGREDNADHGQCYVFGSKALAAREAAVREDLRERIEALADRWERSDDRGWISNQADELRDLLKDQP